MAIIKQVKVRINYYTEEIRHLDDSISEKDIPDYIQENFIAMIVSDSSYEPLYLDKVVICGDQHVHAESMLQYAYDAMETPEPWKRWEMREKGDTQWFPCVANSPLWNPNFEYRHVLD